LHKDKNLKEKL
jgi:hypothetical protein